MILHVALGVGAGLVSAFLFGAASAGSPLGVVLMYLSPLPILIVALGWHQLLGLLALCVGAIAISLALKSSAALAFALGPGLSAWLPAYLALLSRPAPASNDNGAERWFPVGHLLFWLAATSAFIACAAVLATAGGDIERYQAALEKAASDMLNRPGRSGAPDLPIPARDFAALMVYLTPAMLGSAMTVILSLNLWLGAKAVALSGRLIRPWPDIPSLRMPITAALAFAAGIVLAGSGGIGGMIAMALVGAFGAAFALQGLAAIHDLTRGRNSRGLELGLLYCLLAIAGLFVAPLLALLGLVDTLFPIPGRRSRRPSSSP